LTFAILIFPQSEYAQLSVRDACRYVEVGSKSKRDESALLYGGLSQGIAAPSEWRRINPGGFKAPWYTLQIFVGCQARSENDHLSQTSSTASSHRPFGFL
jgi:hypothetical protein